jgi:four helix bundle protein
MRERDLDARLLAYAARIAKLAGALPKTLAGRHIGHQLLRCGTSAGANYEEAQAAESRADFVHKVQIALKEVRESNYWLRLIVEARILPTEKLKSIITESEELRAILSKAVASTKGTTK